MWYHIFKKNTIFETLEAQDNVDFCMHLVRTIFNKIIG